MSWEPKGIVVKYFDHVSAVEVLTCHQQIGADSGFDDLRYVIVDTLQVAGWLAGWLAGRQGLRTTGL